MFIRKQRAGSDSYGHVWDCDGAVVEVDDSQGLDLLRIADGGFSEVDPGGSAQVTEPEPVPEPVVEPDAADGQAVTEPDETPAKPAKRASRRAAAE